jgi:predicted TIM-barrel fold metal-dependent hydrolase
VAPHPEDDIPWMVQNLGHDDSIVMGSGFPHAEGLADAVDFVKLLEPRDDDAKYRIMRVNAETLFSL